MDALETRQRIETLHYRQTGQVRGALKWFAHGCGMHPDHLSRALVTHAVPDYVLAVLELLEALPPDQWPDRWRCDQ